MYLPRSAMLSHPYWTVAAIFISTLLFITSAKKDAKQLHRRMNPDVLKQTFHVESYDDVPEYDVVHVRSIRKRGANTDVRQIHLSAFGRDVQLNLMRNKDFEDRLKSMKMYLAESTSNGIQYREMNPEEDDDPGTNYHDLDHMAAVTIRHDDDGKIQMLTGNDVSDKFFALMGIWVFGDRNVGSRPSCLKPDQVFVREGTIGNDLVVKPVPTAILLPEDGFVDDEMFLDEDESYERARNASASSTSSPRFRQNARSPRRSSTGVHVVYRGPQGANDSHSDFLPLDEGLPRRARPAVIHRVKKRAAPASVWPEILLLVDYGSFVLHGLSSRQIKRYFVSFWNGVDLRYKTLSNPKIRISLAGIIVAKSKDATPYLEKNRLQNPNRDAVDAASALTDMGKYLYLEDRLPAYDMAVVMTKLDMCRKQYGAGRCSRGTAGFAYVGGACVVNKRLQKVNSVAIIEDSGGFSGIIVAAHEVGHLLGCVHDGSPPPSYLGGPGANRCPWEDGFIMSDLRHTDRGFRWSSCSVEQFKHFLNGETASCLYNYPDDNKLLARELPGTMMSLDDQCQRDRGTQACFKDSRVCAQLFCYDADSGYCVSFRPAAEGSVCGDGQVCKNGKCVVDHENIIPDYTHVTRSVVNRIDKDLFKSTTSRPVSNPNGRAARRRISVPRPAVNPKNSLSGRSTSTTTTTSQPAVVMSGECVDVIDKLAGGLTCEEFLQRYGDRYCKHNYMVKNCCYSHQEMCFNKR